MGRIPEQTIQEIRDRTDIGDLIGRYVELKRAGRNLKGLCPFHGEKTPSFNVNTDRQMFHCFGCGEGGDVIGFLMKHDGLTFPEASRTLAREAGIEIAESDSGDRGVTERLVAAVEIAQKLYRDALDSDEGADARAYLDKRGLDRDTIDSFGIGYAPDRWDSVERELSRASVPANIGETAGLLASRQSGSGSYDRLRGRVVFPISDVRGRIVGFGGRALGADQEPKYLNTPETPLFKKREALYGFPQALEPIRRRGRAIICEGYFDRVALVRADLSESLATCGTSLTREHGHALRRRTRNVVLLFDGDAAGRKALERALENLLPEGLRVRGAALPAGDDPDTYLASHGPEALRALVDDAPSALELVMQWAMADGCATPDEKSDAVSRIAPLVAMVPDAVERAEYCRRLAVAVGADVAAVRSSVARAARGESAPNLDTAPQRPRRQATSLEERHLSQLAAILLHHPSQVVPGMRERLDKLVPDGSWKAIVLHLADAALEGRLDGTGRIDLFGIEERLDEEASGRLRSVALEEALGDGDHAPERVLEDVLRRFEAKRLELLERDLKRRMNEPDADPMALLRERQRLVEERRAVLGIVSASDRPS